MRAASRKVEPGFPSTAALAPGVNAVQFSGANGEGPNGKKQVYDWNLFESTVKKYHPEVIFFSDAGPGCRWIGNENGFAGTTNWSTINRKEFAPGMHGIQEKLNKGQEGGEDWVPGEADVSIRPGWLYFVKPELTSVRLWRRQLPASS